VTGVDGLGERPVLVVAEQDPLAEDPGLRGNPLSQVLVDREAKLTGWSPAGLAVMQRLTQGSFVGVKQLGRPLSPEARSSPPL